MNKTLTLITLTALLIAASCSESKTNTESKDISNESANQQSYIQLNIGNYWIYQTLSIDTVGGETYVKIDSVYIPSDTLINNIRYFKYVEAPAFGTEDTVTRYFRDSSGYLIDSKGTILFSESNFNDTLRVLEEEYIYSIHYVMEDGGKIKVPAGEYHTLKYKGIVSIEPLYDNWDHPNSHDNYYARGIGKVKSTAFYISKPVFLERRLIRYNIVK